MKNGPDEHAELRLEKLRRQARSIAELYTAAITARDEPTAARYTCRKKDGSLLWIVAVGRKITVLDVVLGQWPDGSPKATATIQVEGKGLRHIRFRLLDGTWCVYP